MHRKAEALVLGKGAGKRSNRFRQIGPERRRQFDGARRHDRGRPRIKTRLGAVHPACAQAQGREQAIEVFDASPADQRQSAVELPLGPGERVHKASRSDYVARPIGDVKQSAVDVEKERNGSARRWKPISGGRRRDT